MSAKSHPLIFNVRLGNPNITRQAAASNKTSITRRYSERVAPIYSSNIKNKINVKTKQDMPRQDIPNLGQAQLNT